MYGSGISTLTLMGESKYIGGRCMKDGVIQGKPQRIGTDKDYPQAFPIATATDLSLGMSLRDYFAGQALAGLCARQDWDDGEEYVLAIWAYDLADAMLAKREKQNDQVAKEMYT